MNRQSLERGVGIGAMLLVFMAAWATAQTPVREITQIAGEVYRFRNNNHSGVGHMTVDTCGKPYLPTLHTAFKAQRMSAEIPRSSKESWCPNMAICLE